MLVHCHAGCAQETVIAVLQERRLWPKSERKAHQSHQRTNGSLTRYEVRDVDGHLVAIHARKDGSGGKQMWWEQADGAAGLSGVPVSALPLYGSENLPELPDGALVVVTEGEKAAEALKSVGLVAVGTVTGADGTPGEEVLKPLVRLSVVLWRDADDPGYQHMGSSAARLTALGCTNVRFVHWTEAPKKGDAFDAVAQGVDVHQLIANALARPWQPQQFDLADLLERTDTELRRYVVLNDHQAMAIVLWVAHTHAFGAAECTPYISINSAEKKSGKTRLLEVLELMVAKPWFTARVSAAALKNKIDAEAPTVLLDESDTAFKAEKEYSEALRGILNAGYRARGVFSNSVKVNGNWVNRDFAVFSPKAIAGIGQLPDTVQDRSISMELRRRAPNEQVDRFRERDARAELTPVQQAFRGWANEDVITDLRAARPEFRMPWMTGLWTFGSRSSL